MLCFVGGSSLEGFKTSLYLCSKHWLTGAALRTAVELKYPLVAAAGPPAVLAHAAGDDPDAAGGTPADWPSVEASPSTGAMLVNKLQTRDVPDIRPFFYIRYPARYQICFAGYLVSG